MSRLSFRSKLLLVLFVPFLALVVVAAAGLSDRFSALNAQEQYGDLSGPLRIARRRQPRPPERERRVVVVRRQRRRAAPPSSRRRAPAPTPRCATSAPTSRRSPPPALSPTALAALDAANRGFDDIPDERTTIDARHRDRSVGARVLPRRRRPPPRLRRARRARPRQRRRLGEPDSRVLARARAARARPRGERVHRGARRAARRRTSASGSARRPRRPQYLATFRNTATTDELAAFTDGAGRRPGRGRAARRRSPPPRRRPASTTSTTSARAAGSTGPSTRSST